MVWDFGTKVELNVDNERGEVMLKTIKVSLPDDYDPEQLKLIEEQMIEHGDVLGGMDD